MSSRDDRRRRERSWERDGRDRDRHRGSDRDRLGGDSRRRRDSRSRSGSPRRGDKDRDGRHGKYIRATMCYLNALILCEDRRYDDDRRRGDRRDDRDRRRDDRRPHDRERDDRRDSRHHPSDRPNSRAPEDNVTRPEDKSRAGERDTPRSAEPSGSGATQSSSVKIDSAENESGEEGESMDVEDTEQDMMALMGFGGFDSTKGKPVVGNQEGAVNIKKQRTWRQYMNRRGGFNRPLDKIK